MKFNDVKVDQKIADALDAALRPAYKEMMKEMTRRGCDKTNLFSSSVVHSQDNVEEVAA